MDQSRRAALGCLVRDIWVSYAKEKMSKGEAIKPSHLLPYEDLTDADKEIDNAIGEAIYNEGILAAIDVCRQRAENERIYFGYDSGTGDAHAAPYERAIEDIQAYQKDGKLRPIGGAYPSIVVKKGSKI